MQRLITPALWPLFGLLFCLRLFAQEQFQGDDSLLHSETDLERLIVVQAVSNSARTFALHMGMQDGITPGARHLFSTDKISLVGECVQASREYSLWQPWDQNAAVPFKKGQIITYNNNIDSVWTKVPELQDKLDDKKQQLLWRPKPYWAFRFAVGKTMAESTTDTDANATPERTVSQLEGMYNRNLYRRLDWGLGVRYDKESAKLDEGNIVIPTTRYLGMFEISFHFDPLKKTINHLYSAAGIGAGISNTQIDDDTSSGTCFVLPSIRFGFMTSISQNYALLTEAIIEAISSKEKFADGTVQTTNLANAKVSIGIRF